MVSTAAYFLHRLEIKVTEEIRLKIREDVQTTPIEVIKFSPDIADEEQFFFREIDGEEEVEEKINESSNLGKRQQLEY